MSMTPEQLEEIERHLTNPEEPHNDEYIFADDLRKCLTEIAALQVESDIWERRFDLVSTSRVELIIEFGKALEKIQQLERQGVEG